MKFKDLTNFMFKSWMNSLQTGAPQQTVCLLGAPGIGKTSTGHELAQLMTERVRANPSIVFGKNVPKNVPEALCFPLDLSSMLPEDLNGLPFQSDGITRFCPPEWLAPLTAKDAYGVLILDDLPAAAPMMQVAARQCALARRIHSHVLSPGVFIIVTGNRREDKASATTLPSHFRNSVCMLDVDVDIDEWCDWYGQFEYLDPSIPAFLRGMAPQHLSTKPGDDIAKNDRRGSFATPRTWAKLGAQVKVAQAVDNLDEVAAGLVSEGIAYEYCAFMTLRANQVSPEEVFDNPKKALPNPERALDGPDKQIAMATSLGEIAAARSKGDDRKERDEAPMKLLRAVAWATKGNREYCATAVSHYMSNKGELAGLIKAARQNRFDSDSDIGGLLKFLKKSLIDGVV